MIERHITFNVLPGKGAEFEALFTAEYRPAMSKMPGFIKVELLRENEDPNKYQMTSRFDSLETAAVWRGSSAHEGLKPKIGALYDGSTVQVYTVLA